MLAPRYHHLGPNLHEHHFSPDRPAAHPARSSSRLHPHASGEFSWLLVRHHPGDQDHGRPGSPGRPGRCARQRRHRPTCRASQCRSSTSSPTRPCSTCLGSRGNVGRHGLRRERRAGRRRSAIREHGKYVVIFDPLDGSSNIDVNVSVGTIFSILRRDTDPTGTRDPLADVLQPGTKQIAAGYVVYGSSTHAGLHARATACTASRSTRDRRLRPQPPLDENARGRLDLLGQRSQLRQLPGAYRTFLAHLRAGATGRTYSSRYVGSLVADFHRTLLKGGIFLYPPTPHYPKGKLRLMYEANPIAFLAEQAGGVATDGNQRILDIQPTSLHQRTPLLVGSRAEMELLMAMLSP